MALILLSFAKKKPAMLYKFYRICDQRDGRTKINTITKQQCFLNFIEVFGIQGLTVVADNTRPATIDFLRGCGVEIRQTALGNSGSFLYVLDLALGLPQEAAVYLVEDDYLHQADGQTHILEGLELADYVSLYDHPDKYMDPSPNPLVKQGGEATRVLLTRSSHWKLTNSTTMTFAARVRTLRQDAEVMRCCCRPSVPQDFYMFSELLKRGRRLVTPIPGRSTHCDHFPSPFIFDTPLPLARGPRETAAAQNREAGDDQAKQGETTVSFIRRQADAHRPVPVIIPFFRRKDQLDKCLNALNHQTRPVEIFIRDNSEDNIYFTAAVNEGLRRCLERPFEFALILNQDMYLAPDAVETMVRFMEAHPACGIGAPLHLDGHNPERVIWAGGCEAFPAGRHQVGRLADFQQDAEILWANGACMMLREAMIREIGLMDQNLVFIGSDSDYCFTARSRGWQVWRIAAARGIHEHGASGKISNLEIEELKLRDLLRFGRKWLTGEAYRELAHPGDPSPQQAAEIMSRVEETRALLRRHIAEGRSPHEVLDGVRVRRPEEFSDGMQIPAGNGA
jgi:GT2 family glycosyltransferase